MRIIIMLEYQSFKGRKIDTSKQVLIYKNLHNGLFSVKQNGLVVAHVHSIVLKNGFFDVNQAGRNRVIKEKKKNVHAYVKGFIVSINTVWQNEQKRLVTYNPYNNEHFIFRDNSERATALKCQLIYCSTIQGLSVL